MTDVLEHEVGARGRVAIQARSGDVRIRGIAGTVARITTGHRDDLHKVVVETSPDALLVRTHASDPLDVEVPAGATVRVEAGSGSLEARDLVGDQRYRTASGDIRGHGLAGDLTVEAVSGDVEVTFGGPGRLCARTVSGDLAIRAGSLSTFHGATTSGDLRIAARFEGPGPFDVETVSGDALVAPAGPLHVESSTITGDVGAEVEAVSAGARGRRTVTIGQGGPTLAFRSTSGDLRIVRGIEIGPRPEEVARTASVVAPTIPPIPTPARPPHPDAAIDPRLEVLRSLEAGSIDVPEAGRRLADIDAKEASRG
jgi:hypothetical protein